jgi:hypothetical protein
MRPPHRQRRDRRRCQKEIKLVRIAWAGSWRGNARQGRAGVEVLVVEAVSVDVASIDADLTSC